MKRRWQSKPGKHGTLYRYAVTYADPIDDCVPEMVWHTWAYDGVHAIDRFYNSDDGGWTPSCVARVRAP